MMISLLKNFALSLVLLVLARCQPPQKVDSFDKAKVREEIETMLRDYHEAMKKDGLNAEFDYLDQSKDFFWVPPGYHSTLNYDSIKTILVNSARSVQSVYLEWDTLQIFPLSNQIATYSGIVQGIMTDTSGMENQMRIIESGTLIKRSDGWKLLSGQSASLNIE